MQSNRIRIATTDGREVIANPRNTIDFIMRKTGCCRTVALKRLREHPLDALRLYAPVDPVRSENGRMAHT